MEHRAAPFNVRLLSAGPFVTMFDRFGVAPLLIPIAHDFHAPLAQVALIATFYYFVYGVAQPFWGFLSDRLGRIRVIRVSLLAVAVGCGLSALAPNLGFLFLARVLAGAAMCAVLPTALVYVGDAVPFASRHSVVADLLAAVAVGTATGTVASGLFAHFLSWRLTFAVPALTAAVLVVALRRLPESAPAAPAGVATQLRRAVARPWARFLILFAFPEGAMMLGFLVYLAPALEAGGHNAAVAGAVVAAYGVAVLVGTQVVKRLALRVAGWVPLSIGGTMIVAGYLAAALSQDVPAILFASVMIGGCYAFFHSGLQSWATDLAPDARGTATALFVTSAFTGAAVGSAGGAVLAGARAYGELFLLATALSVPVVVIATVARARYPGATREEAVAAAS